jgi:hypothetical protein
VCSNSIFDQWLVLRNAFATNHPQIDYSDRCLFLCSARRGGRADPSIAVVKTMEGQGSAGATSGAMYRERVCAGEEGREYGFTRCSRAANVLNREKPSS